MNINSVPHKPVLPQEVCDAFADLKEGIIVDCTLGYGGHSTLLLERLPGIELVGIDQDATAVAFSRRRLAHFGERVDILHGRFSEMIHRVDSTKIRGVLADIGVSSLQLDDPSRGFGFSADTLDMRMSETTPLTARDVVNGYDQASLERIFREYGEVRGARRVAELIVRRRAKKAFESAKELADFLAQHLKGGKIHPATLVFQAIRIEVNDELGELRRLLQTIYDLRLSNATVAIISFHSLEDRIVKSTFKRWAKSCICPPEAYRCTCGNDHAYGKIVTKNPITAGEQELAENPRARSAKLRLFRTNP